MKVVHRSTRYMLGSRVVEIGEVIDTDLCPNWAELGYEPLSRPAPAPVVEPPAEQPEPHAEPDPEPPSPRVAAPKAAKKPAKKRGR